MVSGGGYELSRDHVNVFTSEPVSVGGQQGWSVNVYNNGSVVVGLKVFAVCADMTP
jgi:hypothetical protein